jgi:hypothetical protein
VHADTEHIIIIVTEKGGQKSEEIKLEYFKFRLCCHPVWVSRILVFCSLIDCYELCVGRQIVMNCVGRQIVVNWVLVGRLL